MRIFAIIVAGLLIVLASVVFIAPSLVPSESYRATIQEQLSRELGREVDVLGDVTLRTFPLIRAETGRVTVANPSGFSRETFATLEGLEARIKLLPLLRRRVEIASFTLIRPDIGLERLEDGRINWELAQAGDPQTDTANPAEPFKRDGRFSAVDPSLGRFQIIDGKLGYIDALTSTEQTLRAINMELRLPNMSETLDLSGNLKFDDQPMTIDLTIDSPRAFLDGLQTSLTAELETNDNRLLLDGIVPAGEEIAFQGRIDGALTDIALVQQFLTSPVKGFDVVRGVTMSAIVASPGPDGPHRATEISLRVDGGETFEASYDGAAVLGETLSLNGSYTISATDPAALGRAFAPEMLGLDSLGTVRSSGRIDVDGTDVRLSDMTASAKGDDLTAAVSGSFARLGDDLSGRGQFELNVAEAGPLARKFIEDLNRDADAVGRVSANGSLDLQGETILIKDVIAETRSDILQSRYDGSANISTQGSASLDGRLEASIPSIAALNRATGTAIPYAETIGSARLETTLSGPVDALDLNQLTAELSDGLLNGRYTGRAAVSENVSLDGILSVGGASLRSVAAAAGTDLPPSPEGTPIFDAFALAGVVTGSLETITLNDANLTLDELTAVGTFAVDMQGDKPKLTGQATIDGLDLRPYMSAYSSQKPDGAVQPWSKEPIPTEALRALNADIDLQTSSLTLTALALGPTRLKAVLQDGLLSANIPETTLYGGNGRADLVLDGRTDEPSFQLTANLNNLQAQSFLGAVAGFTRTTGDGTTKISLSGSGVSQDAIMKSLTGGGDFTVKDGTITGIDTSEFMTGLQQAFTNRALPGGLGPDKVTQFRDLVGKFSLSNGVATLDDFAIDAVGVGVEGGGQVDLGNQTLDIRLRPRSVGASAQGLAAFGIPLRISGPFTGAKPQLDTEFLGQVVQARAAEEARKAVSDRLGGTGGDVAGAVLGTLFGTRANTPTSSDVAPTSSEDLSDPPDSAEDTAPEEEKEEQPTTLEDELEDTLRGLFGRKRGD